MFFPPYLHLQYNVCRFARFDIGYMLGECVFLIKYWVISQISMKAQLQEGSNKFFNPVIM